MFRFHNANTSPNIRSTSKATSDDKKNPPMNSQTPPKALNSIGVTSSLTALFCLFMPFMTLSTLKASTSYTFINHPQYKLFIIPITIVACLYLLKQQRVAYITSTINFVLLVYEVVPIIKLSHNLGKYTPYICGNLTFWFYLLIVSSFVMMISPFIHKSIIKSN